MNEVTRDRVEVSSFTVEYFVCEPGKEDEGADSGGEADYE